MTLTDEQSFIHSIDLIQRLRTQTPLFADMQHSERLPTPWYGRVRQWLHQRLIDWADKLNYWAWRIDYQAPLKHPPAYLNTGLTVNFPKYAPLTTTKEQPTDGQE